MELEDYAALGFSSVRSHRMRSFLSALGIAIGIAAVILLTSIGEGTHRYLLSEFTQFGTNILAVNPGKTETTGIPGVLGGTTHKLSIDDAQALTKIPGVEKVVPVAVGQARVEGQGRGRSVFVYGVTADVPEVWKFSIGVGTFLPHGDPRRGALVAVLGPKLKNELFGDTNALGKFVRIADVRFRVIGIMKPKGRMLGFDIDDSVYVPVATAMRMFNMEELQEIDVLFSSEKLTDRVSEAVRMVLKERHGGKEDVTITTQTAMLDVLDNVLGVITFAVGAIAAISLLVGAIGIFSMMWISVSERVSEIGLLLAIGATGKDVHRLFLFEAIMLTLGGGVLGIALGFGGAMLLHSFFESLPVHISLRFALTALAVCFLTGIFAGVAPARRAAALHPVEALRTE